MNSNPLFDQQAPRRALAGIARAFYQQGWMAGTAGNLSCRDPGNPDSFWITASGQSKGYLDEDRFLLVAVADGQLLEQRRPELKPSAETCLHQWVYRRFPEARACFHVHSVPACLADRHQDGDAVPLPALEMIKGLDIWEQNPAVSLPLLDNCLQVPDIARDLQSRFADQDPEVPGFLIRGHGITVWGESLEQAFNRVEIMEFLLSYLASG